MKKTAKALTPLICVFAAVKTAGDTEDNSRQEESYVYVGGWHA